LAYETARKHRLHERQLGWKNFRVPIVVPNPKRAANIRAMLNRTPALKGSRCSLSRINRRSTRHRIFSLTNGSPAGNPHTLI
jgi:hypothetical protein